VESCKLRHFNPFEFFDYTNFQPAMILLATNASVRWELDGIFSRITGFLGLIILIYVLPHR